MLDTLPAMRMAQKLYRELGFTEAPAYYQTPIEGTMFLALNLENWSAAEVENTQLYHLFDFNRAWAGQMRQADPGFFDKLASAGARVPVDRLLRLAGAGQPDRRAAAGRGVRPSQHRQRGGTLISTACR